MGRKKKKVVWAVVTVTLRKCQNFFLIVTHLHAGKDAMKSVRALVRGAVDSWIQDPFTLGPQKYRERSFLKDSNLLDHIRPITADAQKIGAKDPERERNYWKRQRAARGGVNK